MTMHMVFSPSDEASTGCYSFESFTSEEDALEFFQERVSNYVDVSYWTQADWDAVIADREFRSFDRSTVKMVEISLD